MLDLFLAVAHQVLIFGLFGVLFAEFIQVRPGLDQANARRFLWARLLLFPLLLAFAAPMARGFGEMA